LSPISDVTSVDGHGGIDSVILFGTEALQKRRSYGCDSRRKKVHIEFKADILKGINRRKP